MSEALEKEVRTLRRTVWGLGAAVAVLAAPLLMAAAGPGPDELTVRSLRVVDDNGVVRAILAGSVPDPASGPRAGAGAGLIIYGPDGNERGGYMTVDAGGEALLTLDDVKGREVFKVVANADAGASAFIQHQRGATVALTTFRGDPELHLIDKGGRTGATLPAGAAPLP